MFSGRVRTCSPGVTLIEAIIASTISLFILSSMAYVFWARQLHTERIQARIDLNQVALTALGHLKREISESNPVCVDVDQPGSVIFPSPRDLSGDFANLSGGLLFHKVVCYRLDSTERMLLRQEEALSVPTVDPAEPSAMTPQRSVSYFESSGLPARVIARDVDSFQITRQELTGDQGFSSRIHLTLGLTRNVRRRSFGIEVETTIIPQN